MQICYIKKPTKTQSSILVMIVSSTNLLGYWIAMLSFKPIGWDCFYVLIVTTKGDSEVTSHLLPLVRIREVAGSCKDFLGCYSCLPFCCCFELMDEFFQIRGE